MPVQRSESRNNCMRAKLSYRPIWVGRIAVGRLYGRTLIGIASMKTKLSGSTKNVGLVRVGDVNLGIKNKVTTLNLFFT